MAVVGCGGDDGDEPNTEPKKIVITGLGDLTGEVYIMVYSSFGEDGMTAGGSGTISGASVELPLYAYSEEGEQSAWTGNGPHYLMLSVGEAGYVFTDGKTFEQLGIDFSSEQGAAKLPKYSITAATSTIAFDKFKASPVGE
ncbi:MAG: hypothetical protein LBL45_11270 [Treponema sp.]|jgi:hypothetical protein|nr:hypothetical protein [Treponema sp.]